MLIIDPFKLSGVVMETSAGNLALIHSNWHLTLALLSEMHLTPEQAKAIADSFRRAQQALEVIALNATAIDADVFLDALKGRTSEALDAVLGVGWTELD